MNIFPVTASILSSKELGEFVKKKYALSKNYSCTLFRTGMNHTYFLNNNKKKYVLRVYSHNWRSKSEIEEEVNLLKLLYENNLSVSYPINDINGELIQKISAPEGIRYMVVFSFAEGEKVRFINNKTCYNIGFLMAKIHNITLNKSINRVSYNKLSLIEKSYQELKQYFSEDLPEMCFIKSFSDNFKNSEFNEIDKGIIHMDIWYDNMCITTDNNITFFDFDFCGNGWFILDIAYFCKQLFFIETDKEQYELKAKSFLNGYQNVKKLSDKELNLIPKAGAAIFIFYLGIQAKRYDWSNIFLSKNYLKMFIGRIKSWNAYHEQQL
ncbi:phosphotransferase [Neotamlana laminarinivorans]|uniref:Phosphotransferase n=1 Tax=Neotamlana laminarinivorans TaxID=2883124 RepID=A0A9X1HYX9_9FLAO|nr:phosphotransferase [Tamlana laminarinivorans]MCB4798683.1 phosphotransferase [Tamlana laminarinivorans]